jgi:transketolase
VVTAEEHTIIGGLGSAVAETLLEAGVARPFKRIGFPDVFTEELGSQNDIMGKYGISVEGLCTTAGTLLGKK